MNEKKDIQINFIGDFSWELPENAVLVANDTDYVNAAAILDVCNETHPLVFWVKKKHYCIWLLTLAEELGLGDVVGESEMTPRLVLENKWRVVTPSWLTDEMVNDNKLLAMDIPPYPAENFVDKYLAGILSPEYGSVKLDPEDLPKLVFSAIEHSDAITNNSLLNKTLEEKCQAWQEKSPYPWTPYVCSQLLNNPKSLWQDLTLLKLLSGYPEKTLGFLVVADHLATLRSIPISILKGMDLCPEAVEQAIQQIELICNEFSGAINSETEFCKLLAKMSGYLPIEFQAIEKIIGTGLFQVKAETIKSVKAKFINCRELGTSELAKLDRFVVPNIPARPDTNKNWGINDWLSWSVDEYMPYRDWQQKYGQYDSEVEKSTQVFSDWYLRNYVDVQKQKQYSLVHALADWKDQILADELSIILMVDCMPLNVWEYLLSALQRARLHRHELNYRFTPLPTYTSEVKKLLVSGDWEQKSENYAAILEERSVKEWSSKKAQYTSSVKELQELNITGNNTVVLMNYIAGDEILHEDHSASGSSYDLELVDKYGKLADAVNSLVSKAKDPSAAGVYVFTDHGATLILDEERHSFESGVIKKLFSDEHHRFAKVDEDKADKVPDSLWELGYQFKSPFYADDSTYFIPKGHNTVKLLKAGKGFVHGGATPEEVIVPTAVFRKAKMAVQKLLIRFTNLNNQKLRVYIQRLETVKLEIQNPNEQAVEIKTISVVAPDCDLKPYIVPLVSGKDTAEVELQCMFPASANNADSFKLSIEYTIVGEADSIETEVNAEFNKVREPGISLEDLLS